ncbi:MAG: hypothetical protein LQ343_004068 [Gyalolechia ehrenbergii]|nr:MAG: hypothetical protein LQ343_004068 [Gyalolechia ehrenbergii]
MAPAQREPVVVAGTTQSLQAHFCPLPATNWATRAYHACESLPSRYMVATDIYAAIVVSDYLYVDGGEVAIGEKPYPTNGSVPNPTYDPLARFVPTSGLLTYNFRNETWANVTNTPYVSVLKAIEWSGMKLPPSGPNGLMVVTGGQTLDLMSYTPGGQERTMA